MKVFLTLFALLFGIFSFSGCIQKVQKDKQQPKVSFFDPIELGATNKTSNLTMEARFDECGEWGGHTEKIVVYADSNRIIHAHYQVFPFNCDSLDYYYTNENMKPTVDKTIIVNNPQKQSISLYIQQLTQAKISERLPGHAGKSFSVVKSDSTLILQVYSNQYAASNAYTKLVNDLF